MTAPRLDHTGPFSVVTDDPREDSVDRFTWNNVLLASEIAELFGVTGSRAALWQRKRWMTRPLGEPVPGELWHPLTELSTQWYSRKLGRPVVRDSVTVKSEQYPWLAANVDYWFEDLDGVWCPLLAVNAPFSHSWPADLDDITNPKTQLVGLPSLPHALELNTLMLVTGREHAGICMIVGHREFRYEFADCSLDGVLARHILEGSAAFLADLEEGVSPQVNEEEGISEILLNAPRKGAVRLSDSDYELVLRYEEAKARREDYEQEERLYRNRLLKNFGEASEIRFPNGVSYVVKEMKRKSRRVEARVEHRLERVEK